MVRAVAIPVIGGFGGGPWLDGRVRLAHTAIGYGEKWLDAKTETYANVAKASFDAFIALIADARAGRQIGLTALSAFDEWRRRRVGKGAQSRDRAQSRQIACAPCLRVRAQLASSASAWARRYGRAVGWYESAPARAMAPIPAAAYRRTRSALSPAC